MVATLQALRIRDFLHTPSSLPYTNVFYRFRPRYSKVTSGTRPDLAEIIPFITGTDLPLAQHTSAGGKSPYH